MITQEYRNLINQPPPKGYEFTGECRVPRAGDAYIADDGMIVPRSSGVDASGVNSGHRYILRKLPEPKPEPSKAWKPTRDCNALAPVVVLQVNDDRARVSVRSFEVWFDNADLRPLTD